MNIIFTPSELINSKEKIFSFFPFDLNEKERKFVDEKPFYCEFSGDHLFELSFHQSPVGGNVRDWWLKTSMYIKIMPSGKEYKISGDEKYLAKRNANCQYRLQIPCRLNKDEFVEVSLKAEKSVVDGISRHPAHISQITLTVKYTEAQMNQPSVS